MKRTKGGRMSRPTALDHATGMENPYIGANATEHGGMPALTHGRTDGGHMTEPPDTSDIIEGSDDGISRKTLVIIIAIEALITLIWMVLLHVATTTG